jgi:biofilm protein TabA
MIFDNLSQSSRYQSLTPGLNIGFEFLRRQDLADLADGKYEIDGERVFAIVASNQGRGPHDSPLEFHSRYIDLQFVLDGSDLIGWQSTPACKQVLTPYNGEQDIGFFKDQPQVWFRLDASNFAIFFPDDAHAPLAGEGAVRKIVIKIAVDFHHG